MTAIAKEIKQKILNSVKDDGIAVSKLSQEYGVSTVTIYAWIKENELVFLNRYKNSYKSYAKVLPVR